MHAYLFDTANKKRQNYGELDLTSTFTEHTSTLRFSVAFTENLESLSPLLVPLNQLVL